MTPLHSVGLPYPAACTNSVSLGGLWFDRTSAHLLNRLYAKKRKELKERKEAAARVTGGTNFLAAPPATPPPQDLRSVDELLSFIEADDSQQ